ncbi:MAG: argininosuccinate synthase [Candidatus Omnitrophota bacterium]
MSKVILAYSGGLDTSCCIQWLKDKGYKVICFSANLGSEFSPRQLRKKALKSGVDKIYIKDLRQEFARDYILPALKAGACYEGKYLLSTALGRPLIAKHLVEIARREKTSVVAHGCTAKGNDQVRFEVSIRIINPRVKVIAPLREWDLTSREEEIAYARRHKLPVKTAKKNLYSIDQNIWGVSIEAGLLEDITKPPPSNSYFSLKSLKETSEKEVYLEIEFERGVPVKLNSKKIGMVPLIESLNRAGAACGVGRTDLIEDRCVGIKSREVYEAPAAWILYTAHRELENLALDRETLYFKELVALRYSHLVYQGLVFSRLKRSLDAFVEETQKVVSGSVGLKLYKGNITVVRRHSYNSLYKKNLATYGGGDTFDRGFAEGFIKLWGLPYVK